MAHVYNDPAEFKDDATARFVSAYSRYVATSHSAANVSVITSYEGREPAGSSSSGPIR